MAELRDWLREQNIEQYAAVFAENDITFDVLPDLTETDFEKLGPSIGHRRKLSTAIALAALATAARE